MKKFRVVLSLLILIANSPAFSVENIRGDVLTIWQFSTGMLITFKLLPTSQTHVNPANCKNTGYYYFSNKNSTDNVMGEMIRNKKGPYLNLLISEDQCNQGWPTIVGVGILGD